jgi:hypothetical protein
MKRGAVLILSLLLVLSLPLILAQNETEQTKVNKAYQCLTDKVSGKCSQLSSEEKVFSALATGLCRSDLTSDSKFKTEVKYTSQAIIALNGNADGESWLTTKNITPTELTWYLEIESSSATACNIGYSGSSYTVNIGEDKKLDSNAGSCLILAQDNYWLRISPACYNEEFTVSCDQDFLTTTLFKKTTSSTIHVSETTSSSAANGMTKEKVESSCFSDSSLCNYEATLWAALALDFKGKEVSNYLPYLITLADENQRLIPESFLYALTANTKYKTETLGKQKSSSWWMESGDKFYDTAVALYSMQKETPTPTEKTNAKTWLLGSQDSDGCWEGNTRNTAFILASIWPKAVSGGTTPSLPDCETSGNFCVSSAAACTSSGGETLAEFNCVGSLQRCCSTAQVIQTCQEQGGEICSSNERCVGGTGVSAGDLRSTEICCAGGGYCSSAPVSEDNECEINNGICRTGGCASNEQIASFSCGSSGGSCCIQETEGKSYLWIWILLILIVLVVVGIIFRDRLRMFWHRIKPGRSKPSPPSHAPPHYPVHHRPLMHRVPERRIMLPSQPIKQITKPLAKMKSGAEKELDDVLKKLKDMGK